MWIRVGGGVGQPMWIIFNFFDIIIKSANVDKDGGKDAYPQNVNLKKILSLPCLVLHYNF